MKCLNCNNEVPDYTIICPYCKYELAKNVQVVKTVQRQEPVIVNTQTNQLVQEKKIEKNNREYFFIAVIIIGLLIIGLLIITKFIPKQEKNIDTKNSTTTTSMVTIKSNNKGIPSSFNYPLSIGQTALSSIYDPIEKKTSVVDVTGIRFITGEEADLLAESQMMVLPNENLVWEVLEYKVRFNDLEYLNNRKISPILSPFFMTWNGGSYINYDEINHIVEFKNIYSGDDISNNGEAIIQTLYFIPNGLSEYSICLGNINNTFGCFAK